MAQAATVQRYSVAEYLQIEESSDTKHEFFNGEIFAMAGGTPEHSLVAANLIGEMRNALKGRGCAVYTSDLRVRIDETGLYTHPDVTVVCGEPLLTESPGTSLTNPMLIAEVLSPSTEGYDRGVKFQNYRTVPSLSTYLLISDSSPRIEQFVRAANETWQLNFASGLEATIRLSALDITLSLREIYAGVKFPPAQLPPSDERPQPLDSRRAGS